MIKKKRTLVLNFVKGGGLGNQMFEWAGGLAIARQLGMDYEWDWPDSGKRDYALGEFGINSVPVDPYTMVFNQIRLRGVTATAEAIERIKASEHERVGIRCPFQEERCFSSVSDEVRRAFKVSPIVPDTVAGCTPVSVHVRRGDYVGHPRLDVVTEKYFQNAVRLMRRKVVAPQFFVFSDDTDWCEVLFRGEEDVTVMPRQSPMDVLRMMVGCDAHIISNSTFGWWGAWLGEKGLVIAPDKWQTHPGAYGRWEPVPDRWSRSAGTKADTAPPRHERAIVYPWKASGQKWDELKFSLRSVEKNFLDDMCPIYILGTEEPGFLGKNGGESRVKYLPAWKYAEALNTGVQLADKVLWMNDDILMLKPTTWKECETPLYIGKIKKGFIDTVGEQKNTWRQGVLRVMKRLRDIGIKEQRVFSTHTPYVFDRSKAIAVLGEFGLWEKFPMEIAYFHLHAKEAKRVTDEIAHEPPFGDARFLNIVDKKITPELKKEVEGMFPDKAEWEGT